MSTEIRNDAVSLLTAAVSKIFIVGCVWTAGNLSNACLITKMEKVNVPNGTKLKPTISGHGWGFTKVLF